MIVETLVPLACAAVLLRPHSEIPLLEPRPVISPELMAVKVQSMTAVMRSELMRAPTDVAEPVVSVSSASPLDQVIAVLDSYKELQDGWDGDHSVAPSARAIQLAQAFLSTLPFGVPFPSPMVTSTGAAELFWDLPSGYVDVSFAATGEVSVFGETPERRDIYMENLEPDFKRWPGQDRLLEILAPRQLRYAA